MMEREQLDLLTALVGDADPEWHVGRTVGRTLYCGDGPDALIGVMDTRDLAVLVVLAVAYAREMLAHE